MKDVEADHSDCEWAVKLDQRMGRIAAKSLLGDCARSHYEPAQQGELETEGAQFGQ